MVVRARAPSSRRSGASGTFSGHRYAADAPGTRLTARSPHSPRRSATGAATRATLPAGFRIRCAVEQPLVENGHVPSSSAPDGRDPVRSVCLLDLPVAVHIDRRQLSGPREGHANGCRRGDFAAVQAIHLRDETSPSGSSAGRVMVSGFRLRPLPSPDGSAGPMAARRTELGARAGSDPRCPGRDGSRRCTRSLIRALTVRRRVVR